MDINKVAFFTISSKNYAPQVRCLFKSLTEVMDGPGNFFNILVDEVEENHSSDEQFTIIPASEIGIIDFYTLAFKYNIVELNTCVKPYVFSQLFERYEFDYIFYLDPDLFFYSDLGYFYGLFKNGYEVLVTPHILNPYPKDGKTPSEIDILRSGVFNLGFIALKNCENVERILDWWKDRLASFCCFDSLSGLFVDQKWMDFLTCFVDKIKVIRNAGCNVAYWNLHERTLSFNAGKWVVNGDYPLVFFHFSGLRFDNLEFISKYQTRFLLSTLGNFSTEVERYSALVSAHSYDFERYPYSYGVNVNDKNYDSLKLKNFIRENFDSVNITDFQSFKNFNNPSLFNDPADDLPANDPFPISRLMHYIWSTEPCLQRIYPLFTTAQRERYLLYFINEGAKIYELDDNFFDKRHLTSIATFDAHNIPILRSHILLWSSHEKFSQFNLGTLEGILKFLFETLNDVYSSGALHPVFAPLNYVNYIVLGKNDHSIPLYLYLIYLWRSDLQSAFNLQEIKGRKDFLFWTSQSTELSEFAFMENLLLANCLNAT